MESNFDFLSPAESDQSYFDSYFDVYTPLSSTTVSNHSPKSSLGSLGFSSDTAATSTSYAGGPGVVLGGAALAPSTDVSMTEAYVNGPDIHHWLEATISSNLDQAHHRSQSTGGEECKIVPVRNRFSYIIYHHTYLTLPKRLKVAWTLPPTPSLEPTTSCINHLSCLFGYSSTTPPPHSRPGCTLFYFQHPGKIAKPVTAVVHPLDNTTRASC